MATQKAGPTPGKFEIPDQVRDMAEQSVDKAAETFEQFMSATQQAVSNFENSASSMQSGASEFGKQSLGFAEQNMNATLDFTKRLLRARDITEVWKLQTEFLEGQVSALTQQGKSLSETATKVATEQVKKATPK